jgi:hypothetical protein
MELTRRDALAALAAVSAGCASPEDAAGDGPTPETTETLVALAEVLYPSDVSGIGEFVADYSLARVEGRPAYREGIEAACEELDGHSEAFHDGPFASLDESEREDALRGLGVEDAAPDPEGNRRERVRYYLVNELLFAFYATPTGGEVVGTENPPGHPGGTTSYRGSGR